MSQLKTEAVHDGRAPALRADRLPHGLIERCRGQRVVTRRKREGSCARVVAEGMLQVELIARPADERDCVLARSERPLDRQVGDEPAVVGAYMQSVRGCYEAEMEIRWAQQWLSCREAGGQKNAPSPCAKRGHVRWRIAARTVRRGRGGKPRRR